MTDQNEKNSSPTENPAVDYALKVIASKALDNPEIAFIAAKAAAMVEVYYETTEEMVLQVEVAEQWYELDVVNPKSGRVRKAGYTHAGYMDGIVFGYYGGRTGRFILERKTTDQDISSTSSYWNRLQLNHQLDEYALAYWQQHGTSVDGVIYDVLRQPGISPRALTQKEMGEIVNQGTYFGKTVRGPARESIAEYLTRKADFDSSKKVHAKALKANPEMGEFQWEAPEAPKESPHLFRLRCLAYLRDDPSKFFAQKFVSKVEAEILDYADELWTLSDLIHNCRTLDSSPRNPAACFDFMKSCEYVGLCSRTESEEAAKWDQAEIKYPTRLSQSRLTCFQTCRRKHYYRYVAGIVPHEKPSSDKMYLGSFVHEGLEALWQFQKQQQNS